MKEATGIAVDETRRGLAENELPASVTFVCFSQEILDAYQHELGHQSRSR